MALNEKIYLPNPTKSSSVGTSSVSTGGGTTIYTAANDNIYIKDFVVTLRFVSAGSTTAGVEIILKIGTAYIKIYEIENTLASGDIYTKTVTSKDLGFEGTFIQTGDTITATKVETGAPTSSLATVALSIQDYSA